MRVLQWLKDFLIAWKIVNALDNSINSFPDIDKRKLNYLIDSLKLCKPNDITAIRNRIIIGFDKKITSDNIHIHGRQYFDFFKTVFPNDEGQEIISKIEKLEKENPKLSINDIINVSSSSTNKNEVTISIDWKNPEKLAKYMKQTKFEQEQKIRDFRYIPSQVISCIIQTLESIQIMDTTKNFDTLKGRYKLVEERISQLTLAKNNKRYLSDLQTGLDQYKTLYYDKMPTDKQILAVTNPDKVNFSAYYGICILNTFHRFFEEQQKQISMLKRADAIQNRRLKILDTIREIQNDLMVVSESYIEINNILEEKYNEVYHQAYN